MKTAILATICVLSGILGASFLVQAQPRSYEPRTFGDYVVQTIEISTGRGSTWLTKIHDSKNNATCYMLTVNDRISCIKN